MKISTFSIVVGTSSCDGGCPFCISKCTGYRKDTAGIDWPEFGRAVALARQSRTTTLLLTGKGEPTLYPLEITTYLRALRAMGQDVEFTPAGSVQPIQKVHLPVFPILELQTNAIRIGRLAKLIEEYGVARFQVAMKENRGVKTGASLPQLRLYRALMEWRELGLNKIAISTVGVHQGWNQRVYLHHREHEEYPPLERTVQFLHGFGFKVRICVMMQKGFVDSSDAVNQTVHWCRKYGIEELTIRPIRRPEHKPEGQLTEADEWVDKHGLEPQDEQIIEAWVKKNGVRIYTFTAGDHEFHVYDIDGQNLCLADCLTVSDSPDTIRTEILDPHTGDITYHWQHPTSATL